MSCMLYNGLCFVYEQERKTSTETLVPFSNVYYSHPKYLGIYVNNTKWHKDKKTLVLCCMFLAKWKITRKSATICARRNSYIIANNNCVYAAESAIYHCHSRLIYNQPNTACKNTRNKKIAFFILFFVFATAYCQNILQKPSISPKNWLWMICVFLWKYSICNNIQRLFHIHIM